MEDAKWAGVLSVDFSICGVRFTDVVTLIDRDWEVIFTSAALLSIHTEAQQI